MTRRVSIVSRLNLIAAAAASVLFCLGADPALSGCSTSVVLYNASWCPYCRQVRAILARNHIKYRILDATTAPVQADMVRRFVKATARSWEEARKNPEAAVDATMKAKADLNRASQLDQLKVDIELLDSPNSKGRIGWGDQKDWDQTIALLKQYRDVATDQPWTFFHTNEFLPK